MKRTILMLLILALAAGCTANPPSAGESVEAALPQKPPALTVRVGETEGAAALGTYSWTYPNPDGTRSGVEADGMHPLDMLDYLTPLPLKDEAALTLRFQLGPLSLDKLTVRRWDMACAGDPAKYDSGFTTLPCTVDADTVTVDLVDGEGGIFEVHAYFQGDSHGDGYYAFCLQGLAPKVLAFQVKTVRVGWREELSEQPRVLVVRSRAELMDALSADTVYGDALPDLDESFFADRELVLIRMEEGSGSIRHEVTGVLDTPTGLCVTVRRVVPEIGTADMAAWVLLVELPAGAAGDAPVQLIVF